MASEERAAWSNQLEFILTCVGYAVGLGNVWRFPYLAFKNGGGAFLVPYFICLIFIGIPLFYLELCFGQFASLGPIRVWKMNPALKGLGYCMVTVSALIALFYDVIIAWCLYFFFASWTSYLPWQDCDNTWNSCECQDGKQNFSLSDPWQGRRNECLAYEYKNNTKGVGASTEYFIRHVLEETEGFEHVGGVKWDITLCNLLAWLIVFLVLSKGIKSLGKVVYVTAIFPYILLTVMLVRGLTLDGYYDGIMFYLTPDFSKLGDAQVWSDAAVQIFFSLSACQGGLIAMASYNKFHNNALRDSFLVPIINCLTSFYAGFAIFSVLGFMAHAKGVRVDEVAKGGVGLVFEVYPEGLSQMPAAPVWAFLFFLMMMTLGFSSQFSIVETVITGLMDEFPYVMKTKWRRVAFRASVCTTGFLLGLPMTTRGGYYMLTVVNEFVGGFPILFVGFFEVIAINYVYGFWRFKRDIEMMLGKSIVTQITFIYFGLTWMLVSPLALGAVIVTKAIQTERFRDGDYVYPAVGETVGWLVVAAPCICIPAWFLYSTCSRGAWESCVSLNSPEVEWGPALDENRTGRYHNARTDMDETKTSPANGAYEYPNKGGGASQSYAFQMETPHHYEHIRSANDGGKANVELTKYGNGDKSGNGVDNQGFDFEVENPFENVSEVHKL